MNRASQRERISLKTWETYKDAGNELSESLPEAYGINRHLIPDETYVLVGFYRKENWDWILKSKLYNTRTETRRGSLRLGPAETGARYLLLHSDAETKTGKLLKITEHGPRVFSKQKLIDLKYPGTPTQEYYIVYKVEELQEPDFANRKWDITKLEGHTNSRGSGLPLAVTMTELMKVVVK